MAILDEWNLLEDWERQPFEATYGPSAPYFWGAESGRIVAPEWAQGFYALDPQTQATFYGVFAEQAAEEWARQHATNQGQPAPGGAPASPPVPLGQRPAAAGPQMTRPGAGRYPAAIPGQTLRLGEAQPGVPFGSPVAPSTWNPAVPSEGRGEGWGSIGAGTVGVPYGWGVPGFGQAPVKIREDYLDNLFDPKVAPGYIPGSGTYNQFKLSDPGLFGTLPGQQGEVNLRYGLGGTGDPTTGLETQTPSRYVTGQGGGWLPAPGGVDVRAAPQSQGGGGIPPYAYGGGGGGGGGGSAAQGGGGAGGGFFSAGPGFSPAELGFDWNKAPQTAGYDPLITLFMRSDTPTGVSTAAWNAPPQYWNLLLDAIRKGMVVVRDPGAWQMLAEKVPGTTPQSIGGAALTGANVQPGQTAPGATGATGSGGTPEQQYYATMAAVQQANQAMQATYLEWQMRTGDERLAEEMAQAQWSRTFQEAQQRFTQGVTEAGLTGQYQGAQTVSEQQRQFQNALNAGQLTGTYQGQDTLARQQMQQSGALALLQAQAGLQGPKDWLRYAQMSQSTPRGLQDALSALAGNYRIGASGAQGTPGPATLESRITDLTSGTGAPAQGATGAGQAGAGAYQLRSPNQIDLANWSALPSSQKAMVTGLYGGAGYDEQDFLEALNRASPRYAGPAAATVTM